MEELGPGDADGGELSREGRVVEMQSGHTLVGRMEGYLLTGRNGFFHTDGAFVHVIASMFNQHAKWLKSCLISPTLWRQDPNGCTHQDPGFLDLASTKSGEVMRDHQDWSRSRDQEQDLELSLQAWLPQAPCPWLMADRLPLALAGHRLVHGGLQLSETTPIAAQLLTAIEALVPLAPLPNAVALRLMRWLQRW